MLLVYYIYIYIYITLDQTETKLTKNGWAEEKYKDKDENHSRNAFAYSLFYVFFEQYYYIRAVLAENLLIAIAAIILATQVDIKYNK